ncbi:MAG TPA: DNA topoisomerase, partial [Tepidisphaeraceae bacterium]|nr:DNA topoisomerase [Tepidisphaeraceae bacterium]
MTRQDMAKKSSKSGKNLVIVESPAKAKTINKYLGDAYVVKASMGHVRDLPPKGMGVDLETFQPEYAILSDRNKVITELKKLAKDSDEVYLATDLDREGEAIAWHLKEALGLKDDRVKRVIFNAITKSEIQKAFSQPHSIDMDRVNAQQARRILDRVVGYEISPLLWRKVAKGLSAGRVQSVAVRLVVEREREIRAFVPEEYWEGFADLARAGGRDLQRFQVVRDGKRAFRPGNAEAAGEAMARLRERAFRVREREDKPTRTRPTAPFITSTLQQAASTWLGFSVKKTMTLAQRLYEAGYITYMRTDST